MAAKGRRRATWVFWLATVSVVSGYFVLVFCDVLPVENQRPVENQSAFLGLWLVLVAITACGFVLVWMTSGRPEQRAIRRSLAAGDLQGALKLLLTADVPLPVKDLRTEILLAAASLGDRAIIEELLGRGASLSDTTSEWGGKTALQCAAGNGRLKLAEFLISRGADVNARDEHGCVPLHDAAVNGHLEVVRLLLRRGAETDVEGFPGTPLELATKKGHEEIARLLQPHAMGRGTNEDPAHP